MRFLVKPFEVSLKDYHKLVPRQHIGQIIYPRQKYDLLEKYVVAMYG